MRPTIQRLSTRWNLHSKRSRRCFLLLALSQHLKQQLSAPAVKLHIAEFINAQEIDTAVAGDRLRQLLLVGRFDQLVDELGSPHVADAEAVQRSLRSLCAQGDQQVRLAGGGVVDPIVVGDHGAAVIDDQAVGVQQHPLPAADEADRDRVGVARAV
jgi:hypothetical protein